jgi:curved DNA-binding protein CbpA
MSAINHAYSILSEKAKRAEYDRSQQQTGQTEYPPDGDAQDDAFRDAMEELEDRWSIAASVFPEIISLRARLAKLSTMLAFSFVTELLNTKEFGRSTVLANDLEQGFLERYFGTNPQVIQYARMLSMFRLKEPLRALNTLVDVLGSGVDSKLVIEKIENDFGLQKISSTSTKEEKQRAELIYAMSSFRRNGFFNDAKLLAAALNFRVSEEATGIFKSQVVMTDISGARFNFKDRSAFLTWMHNDFSNYA